LLAVHRPELRCHEAFWPEFDRWDFSGIEHHTYRRVLAELETIRRRVRHGTKFSKLFRYRSADFLYLVVEEGIFAEAEIPAGWGLLIRNGASLRLARAAVNLAAAAKQRVALIESIAFAATRAARGSNPPASSQWLARRDDWLFANSPAESVGESVEGSNCSPN
jgi:hypothetical protein